MITNLIVGHLAIDLHGADLSPKKVMQVAHTLELVRSSVPVKLPTAQYCELSCRGDAASCLSPKRRQHLEVVKRRLEEDGLGFVVANPHPLLPITNLAMVGLDLFRRTASICPRVA
jgi:hypothetical protein